MLLLPLCSHLKSTGEMHHFVSLSWGQVPPGVIHCMAIKACYSDTLCLESVCTLVCGWLVAECVQVTASRCHWCATKDDMCGAT